LHNELEYKPQAEKLCEESGKHLHSQITANFEGIDDCHLKAAGSVE